MRVADYVAEFFAARNVGAIFLLAGGGMMHLLDAVGRNKKLKYYCNFHEQASAMAADAYARRTGHIGVCYVTSGPGGTNALTGVVEAWLDSSPVVFVSGQSKVSQTIRGTQRFGLRQFGTFEVDIVSIVKPVTKYAVFLDDARNIRFQLEKAYHLATTGRPGPVWIDIPIDLQGASIDPDSLQGYESDVPSDTSLADESAVNEVLERIGKSKRPVLFAGHGVNVAGERDRFNRIATRLNVPVVTTPFAVDLVEYDHPLFVGHASIKGDRPGNLAVQNADLLVVLGNSLHVMTTGYEIRTFAPSAYKILIEIDEHVIGRQEVKIDRVVRSTVQGFLSRMEDQLQSASFSGRHAEWLDYCRMIKRELAVSKEPHKRVKRADGRLSICYFDVIDALSDLTSGDETIVTDAGLAFYIVGQAFRVKKSQHVINSGGLGTMGFALPASIGAAVAANGGTTLCITGDGSLQTNVQELATIKSYGLGIKVFVINNGGYVSIRNTQDSYFGGHYVGSSKDTGVFVPSLRDIASAYGLPYVSADNGDDLRQTIDSVLHTAGPVVCELFTPHEAEIIPTVSSTKLPDGTMVSKPLHDMYPFLDPETLKRYMIEDADAKRRD